MKIFIPSFKNRDDYGSREMVQITELFKYFRKFQCEN